MLMILLQISKKDLLLSGDNMKKPVLFMLSALLMCFAMVGCNDNNDKGNSSEALSFADDSVSSHSEYAELSRKLCEQMANGDFSETSELFSAETAKRLSEKQLSEAWQDTVLPLGDFISFLSIEEIASENTTITSSVLEFEKNGLSVSLTFNGSGEIIGVWFSYAAIEKTYDLYTQKLIEIGEHKLSGMLTLPVGIENPPVVILIQGSGQSDMDETIGACKPFADLAKGLAEQGVATIRYNKRLYQHPELATDDLTIYDEVIEDAISAIEFASECGRVDKNAVFLGGHSLGGMVAPAICLLAQEEGLELSGMISLAGSPRNLADIVYDQNYSALQAAGLSEEQIELLIQNTASAVEKIKALTQGSNELIMDIPEHYWYSLNQVTGEKILNEIQLPMLIMQGAKDFQVTSTDFDSWKALLKGRSNVEFRCYEDLNHVFMKTNNKTDITEYSVFNNVDNEVISDIVRWVKAN